MNKMTYSLEYRKGLEKELSKVAKKSPVEEKAIKNKLQSILENPFQFKPLRKSMQGKRRVHILKSFVLIYSIDEERKTVILEDYAHHDEAYG